MRIRIFFILDDWPSLWKFSTQSAQFLLNTGNTYKWSSQTQIGHHSIFMIVVNHSKARLRYRLQGYERYRILIINGRWGNNTSWLREGSTFHFYPTFALAQSPQRIFPTEIYDSDFLSLPLEDRLRSWPTCWSMHAYYLFIRLIVGVNLVWFWPETEQKT